MKTITLLSRRIEGVECSASFASSAQTKLQFMEKYSAIGNTGSMHRRMGSEFLPQLNSCLHRGHQKYTFLFAKIFHSANSSPHFTNSFIHNPRPRCKLHYSPLSLQPSSPHMKTITLLSRRVEGVEFSASFASSAQTKPQFMEKYSAIGNAGSMHRRVGSHCGLIH
ncbi:hypothetical protein CDAR_173151 [Caerostris darwini]|uniref:Uncharacterized protein n=1 Tax=Caerostris darwini TaxID=1538125 RepID=A0AAV4WIX5_9ARAC|nr:hypothetical protein CDAR_173151 [Caerostris darwini]